LKDNFFDIGGNSILLINVNNLINQLSRNEFGIDIPIIIMFQYPTISSLIEYLNNKLENTTDKEMELELNLIKAKKLLYQSVNRRKVGKIND
jgi:hypothetical protein